MMKEANGTKVLKMSKYSIQYKIQKKIGNHTISSKKQKQVLLNKYWEKGTQNEKGKEINL